MIWINGTFGVGKTTAAKALIAGQGHLRLFDPEEVGFMLIRNLADQGINDFQDIPAWRELVPLVARSIEQHTKAELVAVQSVLKKSYWYELRKAFEEIGSNVFRVVLDADVQTLEKRINNDAAEIGAKAWRMAHVDEYFKAREWLLSEADLVVDTTKETPEEIARLISTSVSNLVGLYELGK